MIATDLLVGLAALLLLILPGWLLARAYGLSLPALAGFIFGAVSLVLNIEILQAISGGFSRQMVIASFSVIFLCSLLISRRVNGKSVRSSLGWRREWPLLLVATPSLVVVAYRAIAQPLSGVDTVFRWNFLAVQMFTRQTIAFYPPVSASDYSIYAWPDGIAPVVSSLYFWVYNLADACRPEFTAPIVIAQFLLILSVVYGLAFRLASPRAAAIACAMAACSPILLWSTAMGQESGLLTIALLGLLFYFPTSRETATIPATVFAGIAAALGGLSREYGLSFIVFGLALGFVRQLPGRILGAFLVTSLVCTLPWYGRNLLHTGNPFFNLDVNGIFPVNLAHLRLMNIYQESFGWAHLPSEALRIFVTNFTIPLAGLTIGIFLSFKRTQTLLAGIMLVGVLWAVSLGYTAAGFFYSLRILAPAAAIACVIGGTVVSRWVPLRRNFTGLLLSLMALGADASLRALALPTNIYKIPPSDWLKIGAAVQEYHHRPVYRQMATYTFGYRILVLGPAALLTQNGAYTIPLWSPEVDYLWNQDIPVAEIVRRLDKNNIRFFLVNRGQINDNYLSQIAFFRRASNTLLQPIWSDEDMVLFKISGQDNQHMNH